MKNWASIWQQQSYLADKRASFAAIDSVVDNPSSVLDIGCGYAYESQWLQEKYGCKLYLLDGQRGKARKRQTRFGDTASFGFYHTAAELKRSWDKRGLRYTYIDADSPTMPDISFDVIYSNLSCGFHYPLSTYDWILQQHPEAIMIFDIRNKHMEQAKQLYEIVDVLVEKKRKYRKCVIRLRGQR
jgi:SAM-dependent methyltransferase